MRAIHCAALLCAAACAAPAGAETRGGFEAGIKIVDYSYRERFEGETIVRDDGIMYGLAVGYTETLSGGWFLRLRADAVTGDIDYQDDEGERLEGVSQTASSAEIHVGRDFAAGQTTITPFVGLGHRTLRDESGGEETQGGLMGYDRRVTYRYVPVGVAASIPLGTTTRLAVSGQANIIAGGRVTSNFSDVDPEFPDVKLGLRGGLGMRFSALVELPIGRSALRIGPVVEHWRVKRSRSQVFSEDGEQIELFEPANRTTMIGALVSFAF